MFNINLDFKREELQKSECNYSLGPFLFKFSQILENIIVAVLKISKYFHMDN